jgi:hypothetical protein
MPMPNEAVRLVLDKFEEYVVSRHNASSWWNDSYAYTTIQFLKATRKELEAIAVNDSHDSA